MEHRLAMIGFGTVGQALARILMERKAELREKEGYMARITAISDAMKGALYHPEGLDLVQVFRSLEQTGTLDAYPDTPGLKRGWDSLKTIEDTNADVVVEVTFTDVETGQPAIDHCRRAFEAGKHVVTTNKGPVALAYRELSELAEKNGVFWGFEGTVMSGTPALRLPQTALAGDRVREIRGILNGTTNYILTRVEEGRSLDEALREAQHHGYAEADPTSDLEGFDALYKVMILSEVVMGVPLNRQDVERKGIQTVTAEAIRQAKREGKRWKVLGQLREEEGRIAASVQPVAIPETDPLAGVRGALNAVTYTCDLLGPVTLVGAGAGRSETGFALLADLIQIWRDAR
ncbi:MAG: homoserine dehydrogenase [Firmicutes bacterium]|uniref:Homoserine dehydrogenase n=2 Tax=Melghirimyces thermohalophilus TaxID=1236220 RepID=A0A1G6MY21_9BACL|nr:homoserine dehydrogenase [Melghirimyces thermohalophilus]MDA8351674.1 homoserine dehydrogenase [Bacillota bacterium]SDC60498.1 homoserine dehydrogenase [Melghirimyces thermohalophilus]